MSKKNFFSEFNNINAKYFFFQAASDSPAAAGSTSSSL